MNKAYDPRNFPFTKLGDKICPTDPYQRIDAIMNDDPEDVVRGVAAKDFNWDMEGDQPTHWRPHVPEEMSKCLTKS